MNVLDNVRENGMCSFGAAQTQRRRWGRPLETLSFSRVHIVVVTGEEGGLQPVWARTQTRAICKPGRLPTATHTSIYTHTLYIISWAGCPRLQLHFMFEVDVYSVEPRQMFCDIPEEFMATELRAAKQLASQVRSLRFRLLSEATHFDSEARA